MRSFGHKYLADQTGSTSVMFAIAVPAILGSVIFMTEVGLWRAKKADLQASADMAALAGAIEYSKNENKALSKRSAYADAKDNHFDPGLGSITTHIPPISGNYTNKEAVQVTIKQELPTFLSKMFLKKPMEATVQAVAKVSGESVKACVLTLAPTGTGISVGGSVNLVTHGCGLHSNSTSEPAFDVWGAVEIRAACASSSGQTRIGGSKPKIFSDCPEPLSNKAPVIDPYAAIDVPPGIDHEPCQSPTTTGNGNNQQMSFPDPAGGVVKICDSSIDIRANIELEPGTYVFDGTELDFGNNGFIAGEDVTLIFMNDGAINNVNGGNGFDISAPDSGDYAGIAMYADRNTMAGEEWKFAGNSDMSILGALYLPTIDLEYAGGAGTNATACTQLVAYRVEFVGNSEFQNNCDPVGTEDMFGPGASQVVLVE